MPFLSRGIPWRLATFVLFLPCAVSACGTRKSNGTTSRSKDPSASSKPPSGEGTAAGKTTLPVVAELHDIETFDKIDFQKLACTKPTSDACRIAKDFVKAKAFTAWPAGKTVYFGSNFELKSTGGTVIQYRFAHLEAGRAKPDAWMKDLRPDAFTEYRIAWHETHPDPGAETKEAAALLEALTKGRKPAPGPVVDYLRKTAPKGGPHTVLKTVGSGTSSYFSTNDVRHGFIRSDGPRMLVLTWDRGDQDVLYASYAELWPVPE